MVQKFLISTALGGLMIAGASAQGVPPADRPASPPPAASQPAQPPVKPDAAPTAAPMVAPAGTAQIVNSQKPDQFLASKFEGTDVVGADDKKIGDVKDILFTKDGKIEAFVIGVGGFLGMGAKDVALAPNAFQVVPGDKSKNEADKLKLPMTQDQLKQAATFEPYSPPRTTTGQGGAGMPRPAPAQR